MSGVGWSIDVKPDVSSFVLFRACVDAKADTCSFVLVRTCVDVKADACSLGLFRTWCVDELSLISFDCSTLIGLTTGAIYSWPTGGWGVKTGGLIVWGTWAADAY